jgi:hypothetical protein
MDVVASFVPPRMKSNRSIDLDGSNLIIVFGLAGDRSLYWLSRPRPRCKVLDG